MTLNRRKVLFATAGAIFAAAEASAADWPDKPLRLTIGYPPGGAADGAARPLLAGLEKALGQPVLMDYRPGAGGATAAEFVARSVPDGYTLHLIEGGVFTALPHLKKLGFDPVRSLQPLGMTSTSGAAIVAHPSLGVSTVADLVKMAKAKPGSLSYGTSGVGGLNHLAAEYFQAVTGTKMLHVPYKGGAQAMTDLLGGQILLLFSSVTPAIPFVKDGKIKALGVTTLRRSSTLPDVPTVAEQGLPDFEATAWFAIVAPRPLPEAVAQRLAAAVETTAVTASVQAELRTNGFDAATGGPGEIEARIRAESARWSRIIREANIALQ